MSMADLMPGYAARVASPEPPEGGGPGLPTDWRLWATLAAAGAGGLLARRPLGRLLLGERLPQELGIIGARPLSPLISETERVGKGIGEALGKLPTLTERLGLKARRPPSGLVEQPWAQALLRAKPETFKSAEQRAVDLYHAQVPTQGIMGARAAGIQTMPQFLQDALRWRAGRLPLEQQARDILGLENIPETLGPYLPRRTKEMAQEVVRLRGTEGGPLFGELRTTIGSFQKPRRYETMLRGEAAGLTYEDPRLSFLLRELYGIRLVETAKYVENLKGRVLFETEAAARAASPRGTAVAFEGMPGAKRWWVPSREEAEFIRQNLTDPKHGRFALLNAWLNASFRNPNLVNPLPHFIKNMLYKYGLSGGGPRVMADMAEFWRGQAPLVRQFEHYMPFDRSGQTGMETIARLLGGIRREGDPLKYAYLAAETVGGLNRWSARMIFGKLDPALRYARWKSYVEAGMHPWEAANHTWVDLIRYGTRSDAVDFWKSIPLNFFVPWRLGTVTALHKQIMTHPFRTVLFVGAIDYLREIRYRQTGRWTHLPIDYLEGPIAQMLMARSVTDLTKTAIGATLGQLVFGPGGAFAGAQLADGILALIGRGDPGDLTRLRNMFWGLSQIYGLHDEGGKFLAAWQTGNPAHMGRAATNILTTLAIAEHTALDYRPRRFFAALPETLPGLQRWERVRLAEQQQAQREQAQVRGRERRLLHRAYPISKRVELAVPD